VEPFLISDAEFRTFLDRHKDVKCLVAEDNTSMRNSYLILDEYMRFLDNTGGSKNPSKRWVALRVTWARSCQRQFFQFYTCM
jgi:radical S-adenosyl methionine domain-containing protein 2